MGPVAWKAGSKLVGMTFGSKPVVKLCERFNARGRTMDTTLWTETVRTSVQVSYANMGKQNLIVRRSNSVQVLRQTQGSGLSAGVLFKGESRRKTNIHESVSLDWNKGLSCVLPCALIWEMFVSSWKFSYLECISSFLGGVAQGRRESSCTQFEE